ncbi:hypothetical protein HHI36_009003 [Cryptolaemus montrouzieri]|uniref:Uncharacterized protein n=1 Tax=Cryptolaemus montrouzieri TaxID=559131 RepID=A0ABD2MUH3_9CUCU
MSTQLESSSSDSDSDSNIKITPPEVQVSNIPPVQQDVVKHSENIDAVGSILLPSFSDSGFPSSKLKDQNLYESQDIVTKDSITENERPGSLSIKSRIMLFEGDTGQRRDVRKTDVNKEFSKLSEVPSEKTKRQSSSDANADRVKDNLEHSQSRVIETPRLQYEESCVEEDDVHKNAFSGYDADNSINFVLSEKSELGIVSSSKESMSQYVSVSDDQHMNKEIFNQDEVISSEHNQLSSPVLTGISSEEYCSANSLYKSDLAEDSILENDAPIEVTSNISETEDNSVIVISSVSEEAIVISDTSEENLDRAP